MQRFLARTLTLACTTAVLTISPTVTTSASAAPERYQGNLVAAVKSLPLTSTSPSGYDRDLFKLWTDANGDCQDTRQEVLRAESKKAVAGACSLTRGKWVSYYDRVVTTDPGELDIDHMVPLSEAWKSGANRWTADTRERFANDLKDPRSLVAVSASSNRSKSDRDPAQWMPKYGKCRYVKEYTAVKIRWSLKVDRAEKAKLLSFARNCKATQVKVVKARVTVGAKTPSSAAGLRVKKIAYDPAGADTLNGEFVILRNAKAKPITITGWTLRDSVGTAYTFPARKLAAGASVKLFTGSGRATAAKLYAGKGSSWWNNTGDSFRLLNASGKVMQRGAYEGAGDGSAASF